MAGLTVPDSRELPWLAAAWAALPPLRARGVHAVLLHGAAGIGKKRLALDAAAAWLCEAPRPGGRACGACTGCGLFAAGNHPDLRVVVPDTLAQWRPAPSAEEDDEGDASAPDDTEPVGDGRKEQRASREIRIAQVQELFDFAILASHRAGLRTIVLAPAEALNAPAANALLKLLEEPPPGAVFLLVSDALDRVLPTIRSRCVLLPVAAPDWPQALSWLRACGVADAQAQLAAAGGQPLTACAAAQGEGAMAEERSVLLELLAEGGRLLPDAVAARVPRKPELGAALAVLQRWGWDLLAQRLAGRVRYHPGQAQRIEDLARAVSPAALLGWLGALCARQATADHPLNSRLAVEEALLEYSSLWHSRPARVRS